MNTTYLVLYSGSTAVVVVYRRRYPDRTRTKKQLTPSTATIAQHMPPLRAQLADATVSTPSERRQHPDSERARRVESIVSAL